ncbi:L-type lectin-domain containing receptor kinase IV.1-like [Coffea eugenioides]|uniref:L-type lectin-domain containing receptor kinase IV.1-like n=1 Tax=Coffea eugenioides TaxID=49369 RepID=UPI000F612BEB|nr:L-type lectin-domain containing receptor kinase IV.1-like [Coffea eugenioides]
MLLKTTLVLVVACILAGCAALNDPGFSYNGFQSANLIVDGAARIRRNGILELTNTSDSRKGGMGHAFFPNPINFKNTSNSSVFSFSTYFVFAMVPEFPTLAGGHGIVFVIAPTRGLPGAQSKGFLGLFNESNNGNATNHVFGVELDTDETNDFGDINDNHVGIDINSLRSKAAKPAGYQASNGSDLDISLTSGQPIQIWVEYNGLDKQIDVTLAPLSQGKPNASLLTLSYDLSPILKRKMYVGFSSSTGSRPTSHYILGWSFQINGIAQRLDLSRLPKLPRVGKKEASQLLTIGLPLICVISTSIAISGVVYYVRRKRKFAEVVEEWELAYGPHRFKYKDLYIATKGFKDKDLLGAGGFGKVYRGVLPTNNIEVAVKKVSHESRQGIREFVAEIVSIGRLRHRNLVPLLGYCRRKSELLLVYEFMSNGSLDRFLYNQKDYTLNWNERFRVIKGVASGLLYLHEEWEQVVIHRDVKASNVLLDSELNGRLGDFGLARLYDHGTAPQTTHVVGTLGYLAPELNRRGKATTGTDVYAFGAFMLEVACGRRPIEPAAPTEDVVLVDRVYSCWNRGEILEAVDPKLGADYVIEEAELVLKLGLLCSHSEPTARPSMRQVLLYLECSAELPELPSLGITANGLASAGYDGSNDFISSYPSSAEKPCSKSSSFIADSVLSGGR